MIKKLIFDVDDTLIDWKMEYFHNSIQETLKQCGYDADINTSTKMREILDIYEEENFEKPFIKENMRKHFNKYMGYNLDETFMDKWISLLSQCAPEDMGNERYELLEYLNNKYELAVLTNWLNISQHKRIEKTKMSKYFKEIYATEDIPRKPNKIAFITAINGNKPEECIMIGDNFIDDIQGALNAGLNAIWLDKKNGCSKKTITDEKNREIRVIHKLEELKNIL